MFGDNGEFDRLIEKVFFDNFREGMTELEFTYEDIEQAAHDLEIILSGNFEDILLSFDNYSNLPDKIERSQSAGHRTKRNEIKQKYHKVKAKSNDYITPRNDIVVTKIFDLTPELIRAYALDDEQALLAVVRYNRLIDTFLGLTAYSLQNHLRTTVKGMGQIEIDELYIGLDRNGCHHVIPVQAKGGKDRIGVVQTAQDIGFAGQRFPGMRCRAIAAQFMQDDVIALFELTLRGDEIRVVEERHYRLVPADRLDPAAVRNYRD